MVWYHFQQYYTFKLIRMGDFLIYKLYMKLRKVYINA